jgi:hypothetical protein
MAVPATRLAADLQALLAHAGARTVRVVDGRAGSVVAQAGDAASGPDDPAAVAGLLREAVALGEGGLDDVLVTTDRSLHVLRPAPVAGVFVHLRLDLGADPVRARRALADPALQDAVRRAVTAEPASDLTAPLDVVAPTAAAAPDVSAETVAVPVVAPAPAAPPTVTPPAVARPTAPSAVAATFGRAPALPARVAPVAVVEEGPVLAEPAVPAPAAPAPAVTAGPTSSGGGLFTPVTPAEPEAPAGDAAPAADTAAGAAVRGAWVDPATEPALGGAGRSGPQALPQPRTADAPETAETVAAPETAAPVATAPEPGAAEQARSGTAGTTGTTGTAGTTTRRTRPAAPGQQPALAVLAADPARSGAGARAAVALAELSRPDAPPVVLPRRRSAGAVRSVPAPRSGGSTTGLPDRAWAKDLDTLRRLADGLRRLS